MTWASGFTLRREILELFAEAQRMHVRCDRVARWLCTTHATKNGKRRNQYDAHRYMQTTWYRLMLERHRKNAIRWRSENPDKYAAIQLRKKATVLSRRIARMTGRMCKKCGIPVPLRNGSGPVPQFCSCRCSHRAAALAWYYRNKVHVIRVSTEIRANKRAMEVIKDIGAAGPFFITPHAVRRYRERAHRVNVSYKRALSELILLCKEAHKTSKKLRDGAELWRTRKPLRLRLVVMPQTVGLPQLITVKAGHDGVTVLGAK